MRALERLFLVQGYARTQGLDVRTATSVRVSPKMFDEARRDVRLAAIDHLSWAPDRFLGVPVVIDEELPEDGIVVRWEISA
jgi:hypothetical protein